MPASQRAVRQNWPDFVSDPILEGVNRLNVGSRPADVVGGDAGMVIFISDVREHVHLYRFLNFKTDLLAAHASFSIRDAGGVIAFLPTNRRNFRLTQKARQPSPALRP